MNIRFHSSLAKLPTKGSEYAAGYDLYAAIPLEEGIKIAPHKTQIISTDISLEIPNGFWGGIYARSGLATKVGLAPANKVGVIDADYRGIIKVALHNHSEEEQCVHNGDRIAQLIFHPICVLTEPWKVVDELSITERGSGGFGSTGTN